MNYSGVLEKIKLWFFIGRGYTVPNSVLPYVFALVLAAINYDVDWGLSFLGLIGVVLAHMSVNMLDDYFDWKKGAVAEYKKLLDKGLQARTHKCFYFEENLVTPKQLILVALSMDAVACIIGLFIAANVGNIILIFAAIAGILGFFYAAPPIRLSYQALGEISIGIIFGPLIMFGAYITAGGEIDSIIVVSSIIVGLLDANIAHVHAIMDFDSDVQVKKLSLATFVKNKKNAIMLQTLIYLSAYFILALGIVFEIFPVGAVLTFITLPMVYKLEKLMKNDDIEKKLWMGPIENWEAHKKEGSARFMMRLCISRNILVFFILILCITYCLWG